MSKGTILSLFDLTGTWSRFYAEDGYDVRQVDLAGSKEDLNTLTLAELDVDLSEVTGIIAQPPCTHFALSGARWWSNKGPEAVVEGMALVNVVFRYVVMCPNLRWWVLENPVGRLKYWLGPAKHIYQPYEYAGWGESDEEQQANRYQKRTCLWGEGFVLPEKKDLGPHEDDRVRLRIKNMPETKDRAHKRSVTPSGFARAWKEANP